MPEVHFRVEWPDGEVSHCYSPSTVILKYFQAGMELTIEELSARSIEAFEKASERVEAVYGYRCSSAATQREQILAAASKFQNSDKVKILSMEIGP